jgi:hypothetical protein
MPMWLAGSARHDEDFIQTKMRESVQLTAQGMQSSTYIYNKKLWDVKPHDFPSGETFRVFRGTAEIPPQIVGADSKLYHSDHVIDVPIELRTSFDTQPINVALRDICGLPSGEIGNFVIEVEKAKSCFNRANMFTKDSYTFVGGDLPKIYKSYLTNVRKDRVRFCHIDFSRTRDCTGLAIGHVDKWVFNTPSIIVEGILEIPPVPGSVVPWEAIINFLFRLSRHIPLYGISADQVGIHYLKENIEHWGFKTCKISDNPGSDIYHRFLTPLAERRIQLALHKKTQDELLALVVDEKTGKVSKPAGGSKDCIDAVVGLVETLHLARTFLHSPQNWNVPHIPEMKWMDDGSYMVTGGTPMYVTPQV